MNGKSQSECAAALGLAGGARTYQRIETGAVRPDADVVDRIGRLTGGTVSPAHMHAVRLAWLKANRPEKFDASPQDGPADLPAGPGATADHAPGPAFSGEGACFEARPDGRAARREDRGSGCGAVKEAAE